MYEFSFQSVLSHIEDSGSSCLSPYYEGKDYECAFDELEKFICLLQTDEYYYLLSGDLRPCLPVRLHFCMFL